MPLLLQRQQDVLISKFASCRHFENLYITGMEQTFAYVCAIGGLAGVAAIREKLRTENAELKGQLKEHYKLAP